MTRVEYAVRREKATFACVGHAADPRVCAAASALCMALLARLETLEEAGQAVIRDLVAEPGEVRLSVSPVLPEEDASAVNDAVETVAAGFLAVERLYPGELEVL